MTDAASLSTTSEYAQLIIAEATHAVINGGENQQQFEATVIEALAEERVDPPVLVSILAMAVAGQIAVVAQAAAQMAFVADANEVLADAAGEAVAPPEVVVEKLRLLVEGMASAEAQVVPALAALDAAAA